VHAPVIFSPPHKMVTFGWKNRKKGKWKKGEQVGCGLVIKLTLYAFWLSDDSLRPENAKSHAGKCGKAPFTCKFAKFLILFES